MSMVTLVEAGAYFDQRVSAFAWLNATTDERSKALAHANRILNRLNYIGTKVAVDQTDEWPRLDDNKDQFFPTAIKDALCETALALLDGADPVKDLEDMQLASITAASVKITVSGNAVFEHLMAGVPTLAAYNMVKPYLLFQGRSFRLERAS